MISDRDLLRAISPYLGTVSENALDAATLNKRVHQIMTRKPITLPPEARITDAANLLLGQRVSCIPIVDENSKAVGMVSWRDVLKALIAPWGPPAACCECLQRSARKIVPHCSAPPFKRGTRRAPHAAATCGN